MLTKLVEENLGTESSFKEEQSIKDNSGTRLHVEVITLAKEKNTVNEN